MACLHVLIIHAVAESHAPVSQYLHSKVTFAEWELIKGEAVLTELVAREVVIATKQRLIAREVAIAMKQPTAGGLGVARLLHNVDILLTIEFGVSRKAVMATLLKLITGEICIL